MNCSILPDKIGAGLTFSTLVTQTAYPAPLWGLTIALRGPSVIDLASTAEGTQHRLSVNAAVTANWVPGNYSYSVRATDGVNVFEIESGQLTVEADLVNAVAGHDSRSHAERALEAIEAVLEKRASLDQERYRINNRELQRTPIPDLLKLRDLYRAEVRQQKAVSRGKNLFGAVRVRLN